MGLFSLRLFNGSSNRVRNPGQQEPFTWASPPRQHFSFVRNTLLLCISYPRHAASLLQHPIAPIQFVLFYFLCFIYSFHPDICHLFIYAAGRHTQNGPIVTLELAETAFIQCRKNIPVSPLAVT